MKTLFLECGMGAAGDMLMGALLELYADRDGFINRMNNIGLPGTRIAAEKTVKCGITGTHIAVTINGEMENIGEPHHHDHDHDHHDHDHDHHDHDHYHYDHEHHDHDHNDHDHHDHHSHMHNGLRGIEYIIDKLNIPVNVKTGALSVYNIIAQAEGHVHGVPVGQVHFHEVGALDAVADVVGVCLLMDELAPDRVAASPVHVGSGQVRCAHGILPVPAPATAYILRGIPIYGGEVRGELCTPTGAALLKHFVSSFGPMPVMSVSKTGYGMGRKDFERANCVRAFMGTAFDQSPQEDGEVTELSCNLDDMTPESIAFAQQLLLEEGALDVYTVPIGMKKGRPGIMLVCMCGAELKDKMVRLIFKHTTTLGMRQTVSRRHTLTRTPGQAATAFGPVAAKTASGYGTERFKPEYEDVARIARENKVSIEEVLRTVKNPTN